MISDLYPIIGSASQEELLTENEKLKETLGFFGKGAMFFFQINVMFWPWLLCGFPYSFQLSSWVWGFCLLFCCGEWKPSRLGTLHMLLKIDCCTQLLFNRPTERCHHGWPNWESEWKWWWSSDKRQETLERLVWFEKEKGLSSHVKGGGGRVSPCDLGQTCRFPQKWNNEFFQKVWGFFGGLPKPVWCFKRIHRFPFCELLVSK